MKLFELAFACKLYGPFGDYDSSLEQFREIIGSALDLGEPTHRRALFIWLRKWGCRQFAKSHEGIAGNTLLAWAENFLRALPLPSIPLLSLSPTAIRNAADAYDDLKDRRASWQERKSGRCLVAFGPAGAAKTLFALRPNALPPWGDPIRDRLGYDESAESYGRFLADAQCHLKEVLKEARHFGITPDDLPAKLGRPRSSLAKLVDEYFWVTITNCCTPPRRSELRRWLTWAGGSPTLH